MEALAVRSSRHNVQFLLARSAPEIDPKSSAVCSSSSAGMGAADSSGKFARIVVTGISSIDEEGRPVAGLVAFSDVNETPSVFAEDV